MARDDEDLRIQLRQSRITPFHTIRSANPLLREAQH